MDYKFFLFFLFFIYVFLLEPNAPNIRKFGYQVSEETQKVSLNCRSRGAPKPTIKFFKDDVEIKSNTNGYFISDKKLTINEPKFPDHDGKYTCSVSNMFGKAIKNANLTVTGMQLSFIYIFTG